MHKLIPAVLILASTSLFQSVSAQDTESYAKIANQLIESINAADYSGVENLFNRQMSQALPLQKATQFFAGMTAQFGKIQQLDEPRNIAGWMVFIAHFERGQMDMSMALDRDDKIAGVKFTPRAAAKLEAEKPRLPPGTDRYAKVANRLVTLINAGDYGSVQTNLNQDMAAALPLDKSSAFFRQLTEQVGKIQKLGNPQSLDGEMIFPVKCEWGALDMQLALDGAGLIAGLNFTPRAEPSDAAMRGQQTKLCLPFKGRWSVFWGGDTKELNQHHDSPAQRFAFDFLGMAEDGKTHHGDGSKNEDYVCFGREIYAPADGIVLEAIDGVRDNEPGVMNPYCLVGNCVIIQHRTNEVSVLAHLRRGSVAVKAGDTVKLGQLLARCGNSGNSSEPHLHYQVQNSPVFQDASGIKVVFQKLVVTTKGKSETKTDYSPIKDDTISPGE